MENEITMAFENLAISSTKQQQKNVPEPTYSILKTEILASINIIRHKKKKRPDTDSIYTYLLRNYSSNIEKQVIELIVNDLLETKTITTKKNPDGHDSFFINETQEIIDLRESTNGSDSLLAENCSPNGNCNNDQNETLLKNAETPSCHTHFTPNIMSKKILTPSRLHTINESETLLDDMFEKTKTLNLKNEIISELKLCLKSHFDNELQSFKKKCEKLVSKSYSNSINQIESLRKEILCKDQIISDLLTTIKNITKEDQRSETIPTSPTDTENIGKSIHEMKSDENIKKNTVGPEITTPYENETKSERSEKLMEQLKKIRQDKHEEYKEFMESTKSKSAEDKNDVNCSEDPSPENHFWPPGTCVIVGDSIITGIEENRFQNIGHKVKIFDYRGATIDDLHHHIIPLLKKKPDHLILHAGTNDAVSKTSRQILDDLLQLKNEVLKTLPNCNVIISKPTIRIDNGKAALTLRNLNQHLTELKVDSIDNSNIKQMHIGRKGLHLNNKGKDKLALNFFHKIRNF